MNSFQTSLITTFSDFSNLEKEWNELVDNNDYDITLLHEWLTTWWQVFGDESRELFIITVRKNDQLVGIAPLLRRKVKYFKLIPSHRLEFIGSGESEADEICSDYLDFIIRKENRIEILETLLEHLMSLKSQWQEILLTDIKSESTNLQIIKDKLPQYNLKTNQLQQAECPYIQLPNSWEELKKTTKINTREQLNRKIRLLEKEGKVEYKTYKSDEISEDVFDSFIKLHQKRWASEGKPGCFSSVKFTNFHTSLLKKLTPKDSPRLFFIYLNDKPIAARYCFQYNNTSYDYLPGLDPDISRKISHGFLGLAYSIEQSISNSNQKFDFFKGKIGSYKYKWTGLNTQISQYRIIDSSLKNHFITLIENNFQLARQLKKATLP